MNAMRNGGARRLVCSASVCDEVNVKNAPTIARTRSSQRSFDNDILWENNLKPLIRAAEGRKIFPPLRGSLRLRILTTAFSRGNILSALRAYCRGASAFDDSAHSRFPFVNVTEEILAVGV